MSRWKDNFQAQQALQKVQAILVPLQKAKLESIPPSTREEYERAIKVLKLLEIRFSTLDPELFHPNTWGNFAGWLNNAKAQADAFSGNLNVGHLTNVNAHLDEILNVLRPIDIKFSENEVKALTEASAIYRQKIVEELDLVKKRAEEIKKQYDLLSGEISQGKTRLDKNDQVIDSQKTRLDTSIAEFQKQFSTAQETRNQDFLKAIALITDNYKTKSDGFDESFKTALAAQKTEWDSLLATTRLSGRAHLEFLESRKKEVDAIYGAIGQAALAGDFGIAANNEKKAADGWRKIAFGFMVTMGAVAIAAFVFTLTGC